MVTMVMSSGDVTMVTSSGKVHGSLVLFAQLIISNKLSFVDHIVLHLACKSVSVSGVLILSMVALSACMLCV